MDARMKKILFIVWALFGLSLLAQADSMYIAVVDSASAKKEDITVKLDKKDAAVSDFMVVDISNRTPEVLSHPGRTPPVFAFVRSPKQQTGRNGGSTKFHNCFSGKVRQR